MHVRIYNYTGIQYVLLTWPQLFNTQDFLLALILY